MSSNLHRSQIFALFVAGIFALLVGTYSDNGGFQVFGGMLCFNQHCTLAIKAGEE
jgi:hypothetical protein